MVHIIWFRRDLRLTDNAALYHALREGMPVVPLFIFDRQILDRLENKADRRVAFIHAVLEEMQQQLRAMGSSLYVAYGHPAEVFAQLLDQYKVAKVFTNHDYEPYAKERDAQIEALLLSRGASLHTFKDQVIFEKAEVTKDDGLPYTVFTPYSKKWRAALQPDTFDPYPSVEYYANFFSSDALPIPTLGEMGFTPTDKVFPAKTLNEAIVKNYTAQRDYPAVAGTSKMGVHLRFGTISIRELAGRAITLNDTYLNELIWRDFYHAILWHFPHVGQGRAFRSEYDRIPWRTDMADYERWCEGKTGYPIVDAGMRELNATGFMHNRVRMIVASFLAKHLLLDWRLGEAWFARQLLDFDLAANNGGWQWASGSGCDAAPYFRVFNPRLQTEKFDKNLDYVRKWVPELDDFQYPQPMVVHEVARKRAIEVYGTALKG
jgi:deoxyribodipyrimidine photo-lyase